MLFVMLKDIRPPPTILSTHIYYYYTNQKWNSLRAECFFALKVLTSAGQSSYEFSGLSVPAGKPKKFYHYGNNSHFQSLKKGQVKAKLLVNQLHSPEQCFFEKRRWYFTWYFGCYAKHNSLCYLKSTVILNFFSFYIFWTLLLYFSF